MGGRLPPYSLLKVGAYGNGIRADLKDDTISALMQTEADNSLDMVKFTGIPPNSVTLAPTLCYLLRAQILVRVTRTLQVMSLQKIQKCLDKERNPSKMAT